MTDMHSQSDSTRDDLNRLTQPTEPDDAPQEVHVTHYAYDPQTYEILCRPGQRLSEKKARRLQELNLYAHVVGFVE